MQFQWPIPGHYGNPLAGESKRVCFKGNMYPLVACRPRAKQTLLWSLNKVKTRLTRSPRATGLPSVDNAVEISVEMAPWLPGISHRKCLGSASSNNSSFCSERFDGPRKNARETSWKWLTASKIPVKLGFIFFAHEVTLESCTL